MFSRRSFLLATTAATTASALGRTPFGGVLRLALPWPVSQLDPHGLDDAASSLFGPFIADSLFASDDQGRVYPALADGMPEAVGKDLRVRLRPNLLSARGRPVEARDVLYSLERASVRAGAGPLAPLAPFRLDPEDARAVRLRRVAPEEAAKRLASPVCAILPRGYSATAPDGTGAFRADVQRSGLVLRRNVSAARGAAYLERIEVRAASDLSESLRAFEAGETDMSWLGQFLHKPRADAQKLAAGSFGWVVLFTGDDAGNWGAPGIAQSLVDAVVPSQLTHLGIQPEGSATARGALWGGEPAEILAPEDAPQLIAVARQLASVLARPGHELRAAPRPRPELDYRIRTRRFALRVGFVRRVAPGSEGALWSLLAAISPELARTPPVATGSSLRGLTRSQRAGVVGGVDITGAFTSELQGVNQWDLGAVFRRKP
ncbi:MAG: ABC transporter substrate-binding protein [Polyangiaceae bacterium]